MHFATSSEAQDVWLEAPFPCIQAVHPNLHCGMQLLSPPLGKGSPLVSKVAGRARRSVLQSSAQQGCARMVKESLSSMRRAKSDAVSRQRDGDTV